MTHKGALKDMQVGIYCTKKEMRAFKPRTGGRKLIASVLNVINEEELSIYRFLSSGAKKSKRQPRLVELGVDWFTSRWSI